MWWWFFFECCEKTRQQLIDCEPLLSMDDVWIKTSLWAMKKCVKAWQLFKWIKCNVIWVLFHFVLFESMFQGLSHWRDFNFFKMLCEGILLRWLCNFSLLTTQKLPGPFADSWDDDSIDFSISECNIEQYGHPRLSSRQKAASLLFACKKWKRK